MKYSLKRDILELQIYGDFYLVINWMVGTSHLQNFMLRPLGDSLKDISVIFEHISFSHVYR
jgi:hypothetical protein